MSCGTSPVSSTVMKMLSRSRSQAAMKPARSASAAAPRVSERSGSSRPMRIGVLEGRALSSASRTRASARAGWLPVLLSLLLLLPPLPPLPSRLLSSTLLAASIVMAKVSAGGGSGSGGGGGSGLDWTASGALIMGGIGVLLHALMAATAKHSSEILTLFILSPMTDHVMSSSSSSIATLPVMGEMAHQTYPSATLYVVATPIGNVTDISLRALHVLGLVNAVACEDTRNTAQLMTRFGLHKPLIAAHQHNEREVAETLIARLQAGERIALVSDAGTPAVSDPGARIVDAVRAAGLRVLPLPGVGGGNGLVGQRPGERPVLLCRLPAGQGQAARELPRDLAHGDGHDGVLRGAAPHTRLRQALAAVFEPERQVVFARELTKMFEEIHRCPLSEALAWIKADAHREKGEFVVLLEGAPAAEDEQDVEAERILKILLTECSVKQAASLAAQITGRKKNALYDRALQLKDDKDEGK
jgi:16S rRNA (cytidine1402-2'-O)-methyltransferase